MTVFAQVKIDEASFKQAEQFLERLPLELRTKAIAPALRAAAAPVIQRAKQLAPSSQASGSRKFWSKKVKAQRSGTKPHKQTIGKSTVRTYGQGAVQAVYVGPLHPAGNLINVIGHPHNQVQWGRRTGWVVHPTRYLHEAAEQTKAAQQTAFVESVRTQTEKILSGAKS